MNASVAINSQARAHAAHSISCVANRASRAGETRQRRVRFPRRLPPLPDKPPQTEVEQEIAELEYRLEHLREFVRRSSALQADDDS